MPTNNKNYFSKKLLKILLISVFSLLIIHFFLQALNWIVYYQQVGGAYELANRFDLDDEASAPTWFSQLIFFAIGIGAILAAYLEKSKYLKRLWMIIGLSGLIFSLDEVAGLHEFGLQTIHNAFFRNKPPSDSNNAWLIVLPFVLMAAAWLIIKTARLLPKRITILFAVSVIIFLVGAVAIDLVTSLVERESFLHQGILVGLEEAFELLGAVVFLYAIAVYLESEHRSVIQGSLVQIKTAGSFRQK